MLVCSLEGVTQSRPAGVHRRLQVAAIETAVPQTDIVASSTCYFAHHQFSSLDDVVVFLQESGAGAALFVEVLAGNHGVQLRFLSLAETAR